MNWARSESKRFMYVISLLSVDKGYLLDRAGYTI